MGKNIATDRYARALFTAGETQGQCELFYEALALLNDYLERYPDLPKLLYNPLIRPQDKKDLLRHLLPVGVAAMFKNFLDMVIDNRRERLIPRIYASFVRLYNRSRQRVGAQVTTAIAIRPDIADQLKKQLQAYLKQEVLLETRVDPLVLGGAIVQVGDLLIDGSIRGRLQAIAQSLN